MEEQPCPPLTQYSDIDGDGLGDSSVTLSECDKPEGYVDNSDNFSYGLIVWKKISTAQIFINAHATK